MYELHLFHEYSAVSSSGSCLFVCLLRPSPQCHQATLLRRDSVRLIPSLIHPYHSISSTDQLYDRTTNNNTTHRNSGALDDSSTIEDDDDDDRAAGFLSSSPSSSPTLLLLLLLLLGCCCCWCGDDMILISLVFSSLGCVWFVVGIEVCVCCCCFCCWLCVEI